MECPCKDCLKYPTCRNKAIVFCDDMIDYARSIADKHPRKELGVQYWKVIREYLTCENIYYEKYRNQKEEIMQALINEMERNP